MLQFKFPRFRLRDNFSLGLKYFDHWMWQICRDNFTCCSPLQKQVHASQGTLPPQENLQEVS